MTDLSPAFRAAVEDGAIVKAIIQLTFVYPLLTSAIGPHSRKWYCGSGFFALSFILFWTFAAAELIWAWFTWLSSLAESPADHQWVADHDGGILIPLFLCAIGGLFCLFIHLVSWSARFVIRRRSAKRVLGKGTDSAMRH